LPPDYEFDAPFAVVQAGFFRWEMSGFKTMPTRQEAEQDDPSWTSDLMFAKQIYDYMNNSNYMFDLADSYLAQKERRKKHGGE